MSCQLLLINGYRPYHLNRSSESGEIIAYIEVSMSSRQLGYYVPVDAIQAGEFEINLREEKCLIISIYRPSSGPSESDSRFFS